MVEFKKLKVALYARVSTDEQDAQGQILQLREWARRMGHIIYREYVDQAVSGAKTSRPAFDEMLNDMRLFRFDGIAVVKLDRLSRSMKHIFSLIDEFNAKGVTITCTTQPIDTSDANPYAKVLLAVMAAFAEIERDLIRSRTKDGIKARKDKLKAEGKVWKMRGKDKKPRQLRGVFKKPIIYPKQVVLEQLTTDTRQSEEVLPQNGNEATQG